MSGRAYEEHVALPGRETGIRIGSGLRHAWSREVALRFPRAFRIGLVVDRQVEAHWPLEPAGPGPERILVRAPAGEASKTRRVLARLQDRLLDLKRDEPVVAIGGGAVLDAAGFAAATVRRGLPWIALPTTVVGMADASVGGKVAVNHPRGKNLLGTFHPPRLVLADVDYLATLSPRDVTAGLAEVYKAARVGDGDLLERLRRGPPGGADAWAGAIARAVAVKARIVEADERDLGVRRLLNYGHTVGHALERMLGPEAMRHGEAVAIGMGVAARIARRRGLAPGSDAERQREDLRRLGLPTDVPRGLDETSLLDVLSLDKKRRPGRTHTFVVPGGDGALQVLEDVTDEEVLAALPTKA